MPNEEELLDAIKKLSTNNVGDVFKKLLMYREAFHTMVGWRVGDRATIARDCNSSDAWKGLPYLAARSLGTIKRVGWSEHHKKPYVHWQPLVEPSYSLRYPKHVFYEQEPGDIERLWAGGSLMNRDYPDDTMKKEMQERIDVFVRENGYVPYTISHPERVHVYMLWLTDIRPSTEAENINAQHIAIKCLRCGVVFSYHELEHWVYDSKLLNNGGMREAGEKEVCGHTYRRCPACKIEERGLIILNPSWPVVATGQ